MSEKKQAHNAERVKGPEVTQQTKKYEEAKQQVTVQRRLNR